MLSLKNYKKCIIILKIDHYEGRYGQHDATGLVCSFILVFALFVSCNSWLIGLVHFRSCTDTQKQL